MARPLLALLLVMTQLLSWSASPLYLCLADDGSVCIDFGPDHCQCCQHADAECAAVQIDHDSCTGHHHDAATIPGLRLTNSPSDDPCDCTHIQILLPQCPTLDRSVSPDTQRLIVCFGAEVGHFVANVSAEGSGFGAALLPAQYLSALPTSVAASAVMRC